MRKILLLLAGAIASISIFATDLNYNWKPGAAYHFTAVQTDDVNTSMMGMSVKDQFKTTTDFVLHIQNVNGMGEATGTLYLVNFKIVNQSGQVLASLKDIPAESVTSDVKVDRKGHFTFLKKVYLVTSVSGNVLAYGSADENSVSVGGQAGNLKVDAYAEFDPKTGALKTGYSVKELDDTHQVEVKVTEETNFVDVLPYDFLELLAVPEESVNLNDEVAVQAGMYKMNIKVQDMSNGIASLNHQMLTDKSANIYEGGASGKSGDGSSMFDVNMDTDFEDGGFDNDIDMGPDFDVMDMDIDMGGFDMDAEDQMAIGMTKSMSPNITCDVTSKFNYAQGMFENVTGVITTDINTMGMKMNVVSNVSMVLNK